jgi:wyosine [tRNA(Phe)-imidazoG37] synthetase (radical SAM superfamily)
MIAFGPVPSRRLGRSLGINNIPPKVCSYSCVYCQLGRTLNRESKRQVFYNPKQIFEEVREKVENTRARGESIDYLTFVPDGEPTLDLRLGESIDLLREIGIKIAVITNASLMGSKDVRQDLLKADWVSLKVDSATHRIWYKINRPVLSLRLKMIMEGMKSFSRAFRGELVTETMLVRDMNQSEDNLAAVAEFLNRLQPARSYISIPTRPPAERLALPPTERFLNRAYQIFSKKLDRVEYLIGYEGDAFASTGQVEEDLLSITAVHPMRKRAVQALLLRTGSDESVVDNLVKRNLILETEYEGQIFYMRRFSKQATMER